MRQLLQLAMILLQNASGFSLQNVTVLLQNATVITTCDDFITKCDVYYKLRQYTAQMQQKTVKYLLNQKLLFSS